MKITANENDIKGILQTFQICNALMKIQELSKRLQYVLDIFFIGRDFHYKAI